MSLPTTTNAFKDEIPTTGDRPLHGRIALFFALAIGGMLLDLATKSILFDWLYDPIANFQEPHWLIDGVFGYQCSHNPGALFGMGKGLHWLFAAFSVVAIIGIVVWLFVFKAAYDRWLTIALGLITGGILGNFYDRVGLGWSAGYPDDAWGSVRDWILFRWEGIRILDPWPNFNIADTLLVSGAILLFFYTIFMSDVPPPQPESQDTETDTTRDEETVGGLGTTQLDEANGGQKAESRK